MPEGKNVKGVLIFVCWCRNIFEVQLLVKLVELTRSILLPLEDPLGFTQMVFMISYIVSKPLTLPFHLKTQRFPIIICRWSHASTPTMQARVPLGSPPRRMLLVGTRSQTQSATRHAFRRTLRISATREMGRRSRRRRTVDCRSRVYRQVGN